MLPIVSIDGQTLTVWQQHSRSASNTILLALHTVFLDALQEKSLKMLRKKYMDFLYTNIIHAYQASMPKSVDIILMKIFNENNKNKCFSFKTAL